MSFEPDTKSQSSQWFLAKSILMEIDFVINLCVNPRLTAGLSSEQIAFIKSLPEDWINEWKMMWGENSESKYVLETAARMAECLFGEDYQEAGLFIREMTYPELFEILVNRYPNLQSEINSDYSVEEKIITLFVQANTQNYFSLGFPIETINRQTIPLKNNIRYALRVMAEGDLTTRFWMLVDRFYYQFYNAYRETKKDKMTNMERKVLTLLDAKLTMKNLSWLPAQNALVRQSELTKAVEDGKRKVCFWVEPFGLMDSWLLEDEFILISFAEAGSIYEGFIRFSEDVAKRSSALGDPTRLLILRLIRNFGMDNTSIAAYLGLSRPTVSVHAKILREAGLISSEKHGREIKHQIDIEEVHRLFSDLKDFLDLPE
jgi:DNA-binding transcriptional ArsR family regulator